jgi:iron complex outermembrane receptor protein
MLFDESVRLNVVGFYYDYQDLQLNRVVNTVTVLENAASAEIYGLESEFQAKAFGDRLMLYANGAWLHARFQDYTSIDPNRPGGDGVTFVDGIPAFNLKGNALPQSPDFTALLGAQLNFPLFGGSAEIGPEGLWTDRSYFNSFNTKQLSQDSHWILNGFANWRSGDGKWMLMMYVKNATNERV